MGKFRRVIRMNVGRPGKDGAGLEFVVNTFAGRDGNVSPEATDYAAFYDTLGSSQSVDDRLTSHIDDTTVHYSQDQINHDLIANRGFNSHAVIDSHIGSSANPHNVTAVQVGADAAGSAAAVQTDLDNYKTSNDAAVAAREETANKGQANGYTPLGADGKVPASYINVSGYNPRGGWDANTNTPTLPPGDEQSGDVWRVTVAGATALPGAPGPWNVGDDAFFNGTDWDQLPTGQTVTSVFARQGAVVAQAGDYAAFYDAIGAAAAVQTNLDAHTGDATIHFTVGSIDHAAIQNVGLNTHTQIDSHIGNSAVHFTEASINHANITGIGTNSHAQIDTHIGDATRHFQQSEINHTNLINVGLNSHQDIDTKLAASQSHILTDILPAAGNEAHGLKSDGLGQIFLADDGTYKAPAVLSTDVVTFEDLGMTRESNVGSVAQDNYVALRDWFQSGEAGTKILEVPWGDWYVDGVLNDSSLGDETLMFNFVMRGQRGPQVGKQHLWAGRPNTNRWREPRIMLVGNHANEYFIDLKLTDPPGSGNAFASVNQMASGIKICNIVFYVPTGNDYLGVLSLGDENFDPTKGAGASSLCRGVLLDGNYASYQDLPLANASNPNQAWINDNTGAGEGWQLNSRVSTAFRLINIYDAELHNNYVRGFRLGLRMKQCDSPHLTNFSTMFCGSSLADAAWALGDGWGKEDWSRLSGVPARVSDVYSEASTEQGPVYSSAVVNGARGEFGYAEPYDAIRENQMPTGMTWEIGAPIDGRDAAPPERTNISITEYTGDTSGRILVTHNAGNHGLSPGDLVLVNNAGAYDRHHAVMLTPTPTTWVSDIRYDGNAGVASSTAKHVGRHAITIGNLPAGTSVDQYFRNYSIVKCKPSQLYNPPRRYYVIRVETDPSDSSQGLLWFANAESFSHTGELISNTIPAPTPGTEQNILTEFGGGPIFAGDEIAVGEVSYSYNNRAAHTHPKPVGNFVLKQKSMSVNGWSAHGSGGEPDNQEWLPAVIGHAPGHSGSMTGELVWSDGGQVPVGPLVKAAGTRLNNNVTPPAHLEELTPTGFDLLVKPNEGMLTNGLGVYGPRSMQFHPIPFNSTNGGVDWWDDEIYCFRLQTAEDGWELPHFRGTSGSPVNCDWEALIYLDPTQAGLTNNNLTIWSGASNNTLLDALPSGWNRVTGSITGATIFKISQGVPGTNRDYYLAWMGITYTP